MVILRIKSFFLFSAMLLVFNTIRAQENSIQFGKRTIALDEPFSITLHVISPDADKKHQYSAFPEILGFAKRDITTTTKISQAEGRTIHQQSITQYYLATREGKFVLPSFEIEVDNEVVAARSVTITVGPPRDPDYVYRKNLYEELMELEPEGEKELAENPNTVFFALSLSKNQVYVGEGFMVTLALYVAETNKTELKSFRTGAQLVEILKTLRPANCWEENLDIDEFKANSVTIDSRKYSQYKVYQGAFYPINDEPIHFPKVGLKMIKYLNHTDAEGNLKKKEEYVTYYTQPKTVRVKKLPPHPLREQVSVGNYRLTEAISNRQLQTGKSFNYQFRITGEGNISAIQLSPAADSDGAFDFYPPTTVQQLNHTQTQVQGSKTFTFYGIPKEPGAYVLRNYFEWVYFNPQKEKYDTLSSSIRVDVRGESQKNATISLNESGPLYEKIRAENQQLHALYKGDWVKTFANLFILLMLFATIGLFLIKH
jgi:hypothetical protein